ncbi:MULTISPECIES: proton-conducting transporter membrane subunit [unclassified Oceanispirochaeta]|uniref:proton-conducting transporter transmembrane domain-containing protein n=1 Tax=unclassified Oceanispirochaeta TaxID=2635722 RepID=UPI000E0996D5|nr:MULTISPECIES: proton-conducting transporter membrane subunit [unclassified Oceanispirochaeta]MBF9014348.1 proton-conducting membrane transporter [Oceanispirochaeta sp. M2]NPD71234.1 proton-conducting membrane transporter [Oceanispirochaeta sp. M1]RDG33620.1 proton-conducting membrane transporter [Oceanispirochaeta sp. M1]
MVSPVFLIITALGTAFLLPLFDRISRKLSQGIFLLALAFMAYIAGSSFAAALNGAPADIFTAGFKPPVSINLRMGVEESFAVLSVLTAALLGAIHLGSFWKKDGPGGMMAYLALALGVSGIIMTRDLFNLFVFLEITSIATYGLIALKGDKRALEAGFKYLMAGGLSSIFFLLGTVYIYRLTGTLSLDWILRDPAMIQSVFSSGVGMAALFFLTAALLIELKPFPANGWALDVYQAAPEGIAGVIASANAGAMIFALMKIMPLMPIPLLKVLTGIGFLTFFFGNLIGLKQDSVTRMLGFSSTAQIGLLTGALGIMFIMGVQPLSFLIIAGGIFVNHLLAKAGLFWIAGRIKASDREGWRGKMSGAFPATVMGILVLALAGLPPFPGFWAKWELIRLLLGTGQVLWTVLILLGSLFEVIYLSRWFILSVRSEESGEQPGMPCRDGIIPAGLLIAAGLIAGRALGGLEIPLIMVLGAGALLFVLDFLPGKLKALISMGLLGYFGWTYYTALSGLNLFFFALFMIGGLVFLFASMYSKEKRPGNYPLMVMSILSLGALTLVQSNLAFFTAWELMAVSSWLLLQRGKDSEDASLIYIMFSMGGAYVLMTGLFLMSSDFMQLAWIMIAVGMLVKTGALGVHLWLPGAYAESEDDVSGFLASVLSKAGIFGLILFAVKIFPVAQLGLSSSVIGWIGALTAVIAALIAVFQEDIKYTLAWSSMSQLGYVILAFSLMNHAGWTTVLYLTLNHTIFKALIFLAVAGVIMRAGTRQMYQMGGLISRMPLSFLSVLMGIIAVSGVPPLSGFGGKWLLYTSLIEAGKYLEAGMAFFASTLAFLYLFRLIHTIFLGQIKAHHREIKEAPPWLIIP